MSSEYITLVSSNGFKFIILKEVAQISSVLQNSQGFQEGKIGKIELDMEGDILECIVDYLYYSYKYKDIDGDIPQFNIPTHLALELLVKADYLDI